MYKEKEVILVGGLGCGDEGKGSIVDYLVRTKNAKLVVRYNGGAQAGHNVVTPDGFCHTFSQFGSGTLIPGVKTHLSRFMLINPLSMVREEEHLQTLGVRDAFQRLTIEENCLVTTPFQIAVNRLLEIWRDDKKQGSCGMGVGQTMQDWLKYGDKVLFAKDLSNPAATKRKLRFLQEQSRQALSNIIPHLKKTEIVERELEWFRAKNSVKYLTNDFLYFANLIKIVDDEYLTGLLSKNSLVIFEGAQGVLLDKYHGFFPYITKTDITFANAYKLLGDWRYQGKIRRIGVLRGYATRHGLGPFVTEERLLTKSLEDPHNTYNQWQGKLRIGWFDLPASRYAIMVNNGVDSLALTNLDRLSRLETIKVCVSYQYQGDLSVLEPYFEWEPIGKRKARILAFKKPNSGPVNEELTQILLGCKPLEFLELPGPQRQKYIDFLQSREGLNVPVKIISISPTWQGKIPAT